MTLKVYLSWLDSATASTAGPSGPIVRDRCHVFYSSDSEPVTGEHSDRSLRSGTRRSSTMSTGSSYSNVKRSNSLIYCGLGGCCSGMHRSVRCPLESVGLYVLSPGASGHCLRVCEVGYVDLGVVAGCVAVGYSPSLGRSLSLRLRVK